MKTHFSPHLQPDDAEQAACGTWFGDHSYTTGDWSHVDCCLCLKRKANIIKQCEAEERAIVEQMGDMATFMKRQEQV